MCFDVPKEFEVPDEIGDMTRSLEMSRRKDRYIGRLYSEFGKVPSDSGNFQSTGELREFAGRSIGPYWAIRERERGCLGQAVRPPRPSPNWTRGRGRTPSFLPFSLPFPSLLLLLLGRDPSSTWKGGILLPVGVGLP